jgi:hypothetical protein
MVRIRALLCLAVMLGAIGASPAAALAAGSSSSSKKAAATTSATSAAPTATAQAPTSLTGASGGSLGGGLSAPGGVPTTTTAAPTVISASSTNPAGSSGLSGSSAIAIAIGAFVVLAGIAYFIWHDARRRAPVAARADGPDQKNRPGSKAPPKARKLSAAERKRRKRGRAKR